MRGHSIYPGDIVTSQSGERALVRSVNGPRLHVLVGNGDCWVWAFDVTWTGDCLERSPRTERGWRKAWAKISADNNYSVNLTEGTGNE